MNRWTCLLSIAMLSVVACAAEAEDDDAASNDSALFGNGKYCKSEFAQWRERHDRLASGGSQQAQQQQSQQQQNPQQQQQQQQNPQAQQAGDELTDADRAFLLEASWNTGETIALACVGRKQGKHVPNDVAERARERLEARCAKEQAETKAEIQSLAAIAARQSNTQQAQQAPTQQQVDKTPAQIAAEKKLAEQVEACNESRETYAKMGR